MGDIPSNKILQHNVLDPWPLPDQSVQCIITSPPYWGLRDYGVAGQLGLEKTPEEYISKMVAVFREAHRVLKNNGTLWVNIGDSYASVGKWGGSSGGKHAKGLHGETGIGRTKRDYGDLKSKDLVGIPWMLAFALRSDGWYLRQDIIWAKPNPKPESVTDRCTRSHEFIFMFSKSAKYLYDHRAIKTEALNPQDDIRRIAGATIDGKSAPNEQRNGIRRSDKLRGHLRRHAGFNDRWDNMTSAEQQSGGANKRSVWTIATKGFKEAHFAVFPPELIVDPIKAGTRPGDIVLGPFSGSGTTCLVAGLHGRKFIGLELNPDYIAISENRLQKELGLFNT